jgi:hypothetical protein
MLIYLENSINIIKLNFKKHFYCKFIFIILENSFINFSYYKLLKFMIS